ncbi:hypothetical protein D3C81_1608440 [compost metagenome]
MQVGAALHQPTGIFHHDIRRLILVREFTGNRLQHVQWRDQPLHDTKFVGNHHQTPLGTAQYRQQVNHVHGVRHHNRWRTRGELGDILTPLYGHQQILGTHHADNFIQRVAAHREQAMRRIQQLFTHLFTGTIAIHP